MANASNKTPGGAESSEDDEDDYFDPDEEAPISVN